MAMSIFVITDELKRTKHLLGKRDKEVSALKERLQAKELEMDDVRAAATASELALKESFEVEGRQLQEEIASLQQIMKGMLYILPHLITYSALETLLQCAVVQ